MAEAKEAILWHLWTVSLKLSAVAGVKRSEKEEMMTRGMTATKSCHNDFLGDGV